MAMLTSRCESPASARARGPDSAAAETRKSRRPPEVWAMASALPSSRTGGFLRSRARSGCTTTRAPPPSVITQQSSRRSGAEIIGDGGRRVVDVGDERRAADGGAVDVLRIEAQVVDDRQRPDAGVGGDGEVAVDVLLAEPGVLQRGARGQRLDLEHALRRLALGKLVDTRDQCLRLHLALRRACDDSPRSQRYSGSPMCLPTQRPSTKNRSLSRLM